MTISLNLPMMLEKPRKHSMKFNILLTTTALRMKEMTVRNPLSAHIWVKQRHLSLKTMICTIFDSKSPKALFHVSDSF